MFFFNCNISALSLAQQSSIPWHKSLLPVNNHVLRKLIAARRRTFHAIENKERVPLRNVPQWENPERGEGWAMERVDYTHDLIHAEAMKWLVENHPW